MEILSIYLHLPCYFPLSQLYVRNLSNSLSQSMILVVVLDLSRSDLPLGVYTEIQLCLSPANNIQPSSSLGKNIKSDMLLTLLTKI